MIYQLSLFSHISWNCSFLRVNWPSEASETYLWLYVSAELDDYKFSPTSFLTSQIRPILSFLKFHPSFFISTPGQQRCHNSVTSSLIFFTFFASFEREQNSLQTTYLIARSWYSWLGWLYLHHCAARFVFSECFLVNTVTVMSVVWCWWSHRL